MKKLNNEYCVIFNTITSKCGFKLPDNTSINIVERLVSSINISFQEVYGISIKDCIKNDMYKIINALTDNNIVTKFNYVSFDLYDLKIIAYDRAIINILLISFIIYSINNDIETLRIS